MHQQQRTQIDPDLLRERYVTLRDAHKPYDVDDRRRWMKGHRPRNCRTCRTSWPCDAGLALTVIEYLLDQG